MMRGRTKTVIAACNVYIPLRHGIIFVRRFVEVD